MKKHLLFVGDLRSARNYGAVATTEALLDLVHQYDNAYEIRLIDRMYFFGRTPKDSHSGGNKHGVLKKIIGIIRKTPVYRIIRKRTHQVSADSNTFAPGRLDDYEKFTSGVLRGDIWKYEKENIEWADIVLINGEGNIVNGTDKYGLYREGGRYLLYFAYLARIVFSKPCYIINHTIDPKNRDIFKIIAHVYPKLDGVYVRERLSLKVLEEHGVRNGIYVPDALWSHDFEKDEKVCAPEILNGFDFSRPYVCIGDSSGIENRFNHVKWDVVETFSKLISAFRDQGLQVVFIDGYGGKNPDISKVIEKNKVSSVNIDNCDYHQLYYVLKHARLFASGRWHASIISLLSGTPVVLWGSDSHKTEAMYNEIDYPYEFFDVDALPLNIDRIVDTAMKIISEDHSDIWRIVGEKKTLSRDNTRMLQTAEG